MARMSVGWDSNSISTLFSSLNRSSSSGASFGNAMIGSIDYTTYSSIRTGSYRKLLKSYYETDEGKASKSQWVDNKSTSTAKDSAKTLASIQDSATGLTDSAADLYKSSSKVFTKDASGNYDTDAILKSVKEFVSDYNSLLSSADDSNTDRITRATDSMVNNTKLNSTLLSKVGISINSKDNTLSVDEDTFKKANMDTVKSLFNGNGSFAYNTALKASMIGSYAKMEASKSNTYNNYGSYTYNYQTGQLYNGSF